MNLVKQPSLETLLCDTGSTNRDVFSPATPFACLIALSTPPVTKVKGAFSSTHFCLVVCVTTKTGTSKGCLPCHPFAISKVLRPITKAPIVLTDSRRWLALAAETLETISPLGQKNSVSPLEYHLNSRSPPSPKGFSGPSFGPARNPSSDIHNDTTTFPIFNLHACLHYDAANFPARRRLNLRDDNFEAGRI